MPKRIENNSVNRRMMIGECCLEREQVGLCKASEITAGRVDGFAYQNLGFLEILKYASNSREPVV